MTASDTVMDLLRHRARLLWWVFVACVIPGALLLAAGVAPGIVLTVVFVGTTLVPWVLGPFAVKLKKKKAQKDDLDLRIHLLALRYMAEQGRAYQAAYEEARYRLKHASDAHASYASKGSGCLLAIILIALAALVPAIVLAIK